MELVEQWHTCSSDDVGFIMIRSLGDVVKCLALLLLFFWFVPLFLGLNLFGIALAALGGMLGGYLRGHFRREGEPALEWPVEGVRVRPRREGVVAVVVIAVLLAMLMGVAFVVLTLGAFP